MEKNIVEIVNLLSNQLFAKPWQCNKTSQRSERIDFDCNREKADSKMFAYIKFLFVCLNRIVVSADSNVTVISLYQGVTDFTLLNALWFKTGTSDDIYALASEIGLPICCLLPAIHAGCGSVSSFSYVRKMTAFQTWKNKIDGLANMIDLDDFSHTL